MPLEEQCGAHTSPQSVPTESPSMRHHEVKSVTTWHWYFYSQSCYRTKEGFAVTHYFLKLLCWHKTQIHYGFLWLVPFLETAISLESSGTKIVYLPSLMKAVNASSQALLGQLPTLPRLFRGKLVDNGLLCWVLPSAQIFMYPQFCNYTSSQCPFSKWSDLHVRTRRDFLGSELLGTTEWWTFIF